MKSFIVGAILGAFVFALFAPSFVTAMLFGGTFVIGYVVGKKF